MRPCCHTEPRIQPICHSVESLSPSLQNRQARTRGHRSFARLWAQQIALQALTNASGTQMVVNRVPHGRIIRIGCCPPTTPIFQAAASRTASGWSVATRRSTWAAPLGVRLWVPERERPARGGVRPAPHFFADSFPGIKGRQECVWRDAKHRDRDGHAPQYLPNGSPGRREW